MKHYHEPGDLHELTFSCYRRLQLLVLIRSPRTTNSSFVTQEKIEIVIDSGIIVIIDSRALASDGAKAKVASTIIELDRSSNSVIEPIFIEDGPARGILIMPPYGDNVYSIEINRGDGSFLIKVVLG